jgi:hypothetical protein
MNFQISRALPPRGLRALDKTDGSGSFYSSSFEMRCTVPVPSPSDLATFKIPSPFPSYFRTFRSVALCYVSENLNEALSSPRAYRSLR